ncbi:MAG TPA: hypothetical protein VFH66_15575 [Mycobacteriales bacterium]|nr:hypothetical protein [Mycobacteriales bacterium]
MRIARIATAAAVAALAVTGVSAAPAAATPDQTFHGTFTQVVYTPETGPATTSPASGTWNVAIHHGTLATATFNIFVDGVHHLAYGVPRQAVDTSTSGWAFSFPTLAGTLTVSLDGSTLSYDIPDYSYYGSSYADVTYFGTLGR